MPLKHNKVLSFGVGSSIITTLISYLYIGLVYHYAVNNNKDIMIPPLVLALIFTSLYYGFTNVLYVWLVREKGWSPNISWPLGAAFGLILSILGRFILDYPVKVFGFKPKDAWKIHIVATIFYTFIWGIWVRYVNKWFNLIN
jgi:hypothetical protein